MHAIPAKEKPERYKPTPERLQVIGQMPKGLRILDAGTGDGQYLPYLSLKGSVTGLDVSRLRLSEAKKFGFPLILGDAQNMPLRDYSFDIVWCSEVVEHLPNLTIFDELERVAKKMIVVTMPSPGGPYYHRDSTHILPYSVSSLQDFLSKRRGWRYILRGLGLCLSVRVPRLVWATFHRLTYNCPSYAFNILIVGVREHVRKNG